MAWQKPTEHPINREPSRCWPMNGTPDLGWGGSKAGYPKSAGKRQEKAWKRGEGWADLARVRAASCPWGRTQASLSELSDQPWALALEDSVPPAEPRDEAHACITTPPGHATCCQDLYPGTPISGPALFPLTLHTPRITHAASLGQGRGDFSVQCWYTHRGHPSPRPYQYCPIPDPSHTAARLL